jgi:hypothetical protein
MRSVGLVEVTACRPEGSQEQIHFAELVAQ